MKPKFAQIAAAMSLAASVLASSASAQAQGLVTYDPLKWAAFVSQKRFRKAASS